MSRGAVLQEVRAGLVPALHRVAADAVPGLHEELALVVVALAGSAWKIPTVNDSARGAYDRTARGWSCCERHAGDGTVHGVGKVVDGSSADDSGTSSVATQGNRSTTVEVSVLGAGTQRDGGRAGDSLEDLRRSYLWLSGDGLANNNLLHGLGLVDVAGVDPVVVEGAIHFLALKGVTAGAVASLHEEAALVEVAHTISSGDVTGHCDSTGGDDTATGGIPKGQGYSSRELVHPVGESFEASSSSHNTPCSMARHNTTGSVAGVLGLLLHLAWGGLRRSGRGTVSIVGWLPGWCGLLIVALWSGGGSWLLVGAVVGRGLSLGNRLRDRGGLALIGVIILLHVGSKSSKICRWRFHQ